MPKYHYKGVTIARLNNDLKETTGLPVGIRTGSATQKAMATGRKPTELDEVALWFSKKDDEETARDYCNKAASASVVLRADLTNYDVTELSGSVYIKTPCKWTDVCYESKNGDYLPIFKHQGGKFDRQLAKIRGEDDPSSED